MELSIMEHEVLGNSGLLVKQCAACKRATSWSYKDPSVDMTKEDPVEAPLRTENLSARPPVSNRRGYGRVGLQLPARVRSFRGAEEFTRTENVSRGGFCLISNREYEVGEVVLVICPFEKTGHHIEIRAVVVRRQAMQGTERTIYGVSYER